MRSPIWLLLEKQANKAMLVSTMRLAFETTIERRRKRASQCRWRVVPLDAVRLVLARMELPDRQEHVIDRVITEI